MSSKPDYEGAREYIFSRLSRELAPDLYYHGIHHTRDDVLLAADRLAALHGVNGEKQLVLRTAVLFHDSGYLNRYTCNEPAGVSLAHEHLPRFGYSAVQIEQVGEIIMVTQLPQSPRSLLEAIICDADLDALGRDDFFLISHRLRLELMAYVETIPVREWYERQLVFLQEHQYFTPGARTLRDKGKQRNIDEIRRLLQVHAG